MMTYGNNNVIVMQIIITIALMILLAVVVPGNETLNEMISITRATYQSIVIAKTIKVELSYSDRG